MIDKIKMDYINRVIAGANDKRVDDEVELVDYLVDAVNEAVDTANREEYDDMLFLVGDVALDKLSHSGLEVTPRNLNNYIKWELIDVVFAFGNEGIPLRQELAKRIGAPSNEALETVGDVRYWLAQEGANVKP